MALALRVREGDKVYVGDRPIVVLEIRSPLNFKVEVQGGAITQQFNITDRVGTEVLPQVIMSAGTNSRMDTIIMAIKAPRHIEIFREDLYLERKNGTNHS